ncbi:MAG: glycosyltransferase, partial [Nitrococcus sp.]|nr:glycosyltransferase [Nitrococcus sp.]
MIWAAYPAILGALVWLGLLAAPWRPWSAREQLAVRNAGASDSGLHDVTVLIPARNEAQVIARCVSALAAQGNGLRVIVIDDQSTDATTAAIPTCPALRLDVIAGRPLPEGWAGKRWARE